MTARGEPISTDPRNDSFDRALAAAARSLVVELLPAGILAAPRPVRIWSRLGSGAPLAAAVAAIVLAIGSSIGAPRTVETDPGQAFQTGGRLSLDLRASGYDCRPGTTVPPGLVRMEAVVCTAAAPSVIATVIVSEDAAGRVGEIHVASDLVGPPTATAERHQEAFLVTTVEQAFIDPVDAAAARAWLADSLPVDPSGRVRTTIGGVPVVLEHGAGGYSIVLGDLGAGNLVSPSP